MADFDPNDAEVRNFASLLDGLPDNTESLIDAGDLRAIVKSLVTRYFNLSVVDHPTTGGLPWTGTGEVQLSLSDATNFGLAANGFALGPDGDIIYTGTAPMLVSLELFASMSCDVDSVVEFSLSHTNAFERLDEPLGKLPVMTRLAPTHVLMGRCVVTPGSKLLITRRIVSGTEDAAGDRLVIEQFLLGLRADLLAPATHEVRRGVFGAQAASGVLFSVLPFVELHRIANPAAATTRPTGSYGFAIPGTVGPNETVLATTDNLLRAAASTWTAEARLHFSTVLGSDTQRPGGPDNSVGDDGDFYAYGMPGDTQVLVYGPKADGAWPVYGRSIPVRPPVS